MHKFREMTMIEMLKYLGYKPGEITNKTYIYVNTEGELVGTEKQHRDTRIEDEYDTVGYVYQYHNAVWLRAHLMD